MTLVCFIWLISPCLLPTCCLQFKYYRNIILICHATCLALLLSSKLKFYLLQSPYFPSLPLFLLCLSLYPMKFLLLLRSENFFVFLFSFITLPVSRWNKFLFHNFGISKCLFWLSTLDVYQHLARAAYIHGNSWSIEKEVQAILCGVLEVWIYTIHNNPCAWFVRKTFLMKQWSRLGSLNIYKRFIPINMVKHWRSFILFEINFWSENNEYVYFLIEKFRWRSEGFLQHFFADCESWQAPHYWRRTDSARS